MYSVSTLEMTNKLGGVIRLLRGQGGRRIISNQDIQSHLGYVTKIFIIIIEKRARSILLYPSYYTYRRFNYIAKRMVRIIGRIEYVQARCLVE